MKLLNISTVTEYNDMLGVETQHPLVSVINLSKAKPMRLGMTPNEFRNHTAS